MNKTLQRQVRRQRRERGLRAGSGAEEEEGADEDGLATDIDRSCGGRDNRQGFFEHTAAVVLFFRKLTIWNKENCISGVFMVNTQDIFGESTVLLNYNFKPT